MKILFKPPKLLVLFVGMLLFASCAKDNEPNTNEATANLASVKQALNADQHYLGYQAARAELNKNLENFEIDLIGISEFIQGYEIENLCTVDPSLISHIKGAQLYQQIYCDGIKANLVPVILDYKSDFDALNAEDVKQLLSYRSANVATRASCLSEFNDNINFWEHTCTEYPPDEITVDECLNIGYDGALMMYDDCCDGGGSGCPP